MKLLLALSAALLAGGCSTLRLAYENADTYLSWKAGGYLDLQGADADELDDRIDEFHTWHRRHALPQYAALAHEASRRFADGLSPQDMVWGYDSLREQARESLRKAAELSAPLLDRLTPEQVAHMESRFAEENRQFARNYLRGEERERRLRRAKSTVDRLEDWVGKLSQAQSERVREFSERAPLLAEQRDRDRRRLQREVLAIVRARAARKQLAERIAHWERGRSSADAAAIEGWRAHYFVLLADLDRSLSPAQRARMTAQLRRYAEDFEVLAAR